MKKIKKISKNIWLIVTNVLSLAIPFNEIDPILLSNYIKAGGTIRGFFVTILSLDMAKFLA